MTDRLLLSQKLAISIRPPNIHNLIFTCENAWSYLQMSCKTCYRTDTWRSAVPVLHPGHAPPHPEDPLARSTPAYKPSSLSVRCAWHAYPRPMHNVPCAGTTEAHTLWIGHEHQVALSRSWRRLCHRDPPLARNGPKDMELTPVGTCYYPPGLPTTSHAPIKNPSLVASSNWGGTLACPAERHQGPGAYLRG
jgi:hypothetical protein